MKKITLLITLVFIANFSFAQINNEGVLKIETGTLVYFGDDYTNETNGGVVGKHYNNGNLHIKGHFTNNGDTADGTFTPMSGTTFFNSGTTNQQILSGTTNRAVFYNVEVDNGGTGDKGLQVGTTATATTDDFEFRVVNGVNIDAASKVRLMGDAQLVQTHNGVSPNTGTGHLLKDQDGVANTHAYNYWSSPVQNDTGGVYSMNTTNSVLKNGSTPNAWDPADPTFTTSWDGSGAAEFSTRWIWKYVNNDQDPYNDTNWTSLFDLGTTTPSAGTTVLPGEGILFKGTSSTSAAFGTTQNHTFEGRPNDGVYTLVMGAENEYVVGNPYPSAMDSHEFIDDNDGAVNGALNGTLYYYVDWTTSTHIYTQYSAGYIEYTKSGQTGPTLHPDFAANSLNPTAPSLDVGRYIPVGQGFVVRSVTSPSVTQVNFENDQRVFQIENGTTSTFVRSSEERTTPDVLSRIRIGYEQPNGRHRHTLIAFTNNIATDNYDYGWDGILNDVGVDDMYYNIPGDDRAFVIQGVGQFDINAEYPLTLKIQEDGIHKLMIDNLENFDNDVYIKDAITGTTTLINNTAMELNLDAGTYENRFSVVFKAAGALSVDDEALAENLQVYFSGEDDEIVIDKIDMSQEIKAVKIFNTLGQIITTVDKDDLNLETIRIPFTVAQGMYVVQVQTNTGKGGFKIINY